MCVKLQRYIDEFAAVQGAQPVFWDVTIAYILVDFSSYVDIYPDAQVAAWFARDLWNAEFADMHERALRRTLKRMITTTDVNKFTRVELVGEVICTYLRRKSEITVLERIHGIVRTLQNQEKKAKSGWETSMLDIEDLLIFERQLIAQHCLNYGIDVSDMTEMLWSFTERLNTPRPPE